MIMQWFINEVREKFDAIGNRVDEAIDKWAASQLRNAEEIKQLKGELMAMKARMGKNNNKKENVDQG